MQTHDALLVAVIVGSAGRSVFASNPRELQLRQGRAVCAQRSADVVSDRTVRLSESA